MSLFQPSPGEPGVQLSPHPALQSTFLPLLYLSGPYTINFDINHLGKLAINVYSIDLSPFAMWWVFPISDYYGDSRPGNSRLLGNPVFRTWLNVIDWFRCPFHTLTISDWNVVLLYVFQCFFPLKAPTSRLWVSTSLPIEDNLTSLDVRI